MYYLIECLQNPVIAKKRHEEFKTLAESGASIQDQQKHVKEYKLMPGGHPWRTILFSIENTGFKADPKGSYYELTGDASANLVKLLAHLDNSEGCYQEAKAKINYTTELPLSLKDPEWIELVKSKVQYVSNFDWNTDCNNHGFLNPDWNFLKGKFIEAKESFDKLIQPRLVLDAEICKLIEHDSIRAEVYEAILLTRELRDSIVHELNLFEGWCDTALSGLPGLKKPDNFYIAKSNVEIH